LTASFTFDMQRIFSFIFLLDAGGGGGGRKTKKKFYLKFF
jgi:hypothetical protein